jgi:hypothetical protein
MTSSTSWMMLRKPNVEDGNLGLHATREFPQASFNVAATLFYVK